MPIKNLIHRFQPAQLYIVLVLSICYFTVQLVFSHITHALTLLMASYHMLCNIFALTGCIVTIKHSKRKAEKRDASMSSICPNGSGLQAQDIQKCCIEELSKQKRERRERREMKLRNTFGWTRIDILTMLIVCIILGSLSFSLLVEALQTLVHIDHQDTMHLPVPVMILGFVGLILNGLTYLLIGGYTMHQGSFLHVTPSGDVILNRAMSNSGELKLKADERQLSKTANNEMSKEDIQDIGRVHYQPKRQGSIEMFRDISSTIFVIVCAFIVYLAQDEEHTAKFIDPVLSIFSCVLLVSLSYPYMKESCLILLQTIPGSIDMEIFEKQLVSKFPEIVSYHDLHIWQLSAHKYVSTVHIKFENPKLYAKIIEDVRAFFTEQGITIITIQPEFNSEKAAPSLECLVQCQARECAEKVCCRDSRTDLREVSVYPAGGSVSDDHDHHGHGHGHSHGGGYGKCGKSEKSAAKETPKAVGTPLQKLKNVMQRSQSASQLANVSGCEGSLVLQYDRGISGSIRRLPTECQAAADDSTTAATTNITAPVEATPKSSSPSPQASPLPPSEANVVDEGSSPTETSIAINE